MKFTNDLRNVSLYSAQDRAIEGVVRVRGLELAVGGQTLTVGRQEPVAVIVRESSTLKRLSLPAPPHLLPLAIVVAAPIVARVVTKIARSNQTKRSI